MPVLLGDEVTMPSVGELPASLHWLQKQNALRLGSGKAFRQDSVDLIGETKRIIEGANEKPNAWRGDGRVAKRMGCCRSARRWARAALCIGTTTD